MTPGLSVGESLVQAAGRACQRAADYLLARRNPQGYWQFDVTAGAALETDYILLELWLHPPENGVWSPPRPERIARAVESVLARQSPDGGFNIYPGGPTDLSATVKAYVALKVAGRPVDDPGMARARERILALGGAQKANSTVRIELSLFGLYPRERCPTVLPEMILLPGKLLDRLVPLAIVQSGDAARPVPAGFTLEEIYLRDAAFDERPTAAGRLLKFYERHPIRWLRKKAVRACERRMLGLGAYTLMALDVFGVSPDHPDRAEAQRQFDGLLDGDGERFRDTAIAVFALAQSGCADPAALRASLDWLREKEAPGVDEAAMSLVALGGAQRRALDRLLARQSSDGGWAAFDAVACPDITGRVLEALSSAAGLRPEHPAVRRATAFLFQTQEQDGSWSGRWGVAYIYGTFLALRGLRAAGVSDREAPILRAGEWLRSIQNADGGWGESCAAESSPSQAAWALLGLIAGGDAASLSVRHGVEYLLRTQQNDGSWLGRPATGTGFPAFPLLALSEFVKAEEGGAGLQPADRGTP